MEGSGGRMGGPGLSWALLHPGLRMSLQAGMRVLVDSKQEAPCWCPHRVIENILVLTISSTRAARQMKMMAAQPSGPEIRMKMPSVTHTEREGGWVGGSRGRAGPARLRAACHWAIPGEHATSPTGAPLPPSAAQPSPALTLAADAHHAAEVVLHAVGHIVPEIKPGWE